MKKKVIKAASLVDRFYTKDGWTREEVAKAHGTTLKYVIPRWFKQGRDSYMLELWGKSCVLDDNEQYEYCDYFAVYKESEAKKENYGKYKYEKLSWLDKNMEGMF